MSSSQMSLPSLRSISTQSQPPHIPPPLIAHSVPKPDNPDNLASRLNRILYKPKYAVFEAKVVIEELGNVPALNGTFEAEFRFRGKKPKGKDAALSTKPSLPNIKLNPGSPSLNGSTPSLPASSTNTSLSSLPATPTLPSSLTMTASPAASVPPSPRIGKKRSMPTRLRQSTADSNDEPELPRSSSPELLSPTSTLSSRPRQDSIDSEQTESSDQSSTRANSSVVYFGAKRMPSAINTVPPPRRVSDQPPVRSGTAPSASTLLDPVPGRDDYPLYRPPTITRVPSRSHEDLPQTNNRPRILSGQVRRRTNPDSTSSSHRKGSTPARDLRDYTCEWNYTITHTIRIPLGKTVSASGASTPGRKDHAPILGGGSTSESGLSLHILEITQHNSSATTDRQDGKDKHKGEKILYGTVDIDLAPFAGRAKTGRRYLLQGCKTNATVKVTVEMKQVAGDTLWAAPPMTDGHHVAGVRDLLADEPHLQDLTLARLSSGSSSGSSHPSATSLPSLAGRSDPSLPAIKSYDHHLKPSDARRAPLNRQNSAGSDLATPRSSSTSQPFPGETTPMPEHVLGHHHREPVPKAQSIRVRTHSRGGYAKQHTFRAVNELSAEAIIESIFNPRPPVNSLLVPPIESVNMGEDIRVGMEGDADGEGPGRWARMKMKAQTRAQSHKKDRDSIVA